MTLPLDDRLRIGVQGIHRHVESSPGPWRPAQAELRALVERVDRAGYDSLWVGDHISFPLSILDPLLQIAQAAMVSSRLTFGTGVYLLPLRNPAAVAKQVSTLDHLTEGRLIFGVGVGGEVPKEYEACGVPRTERGARLGEGIEAMRQLWGGKPATYEGKHYRFADVAMQPPPRTPGGPPIWCGGRSDAALARTGRLANGWLSYVVTPEMYRTALDKIAQSAAEHGRKLSSFGTSHLLFVRVDKTYDAALDAASAMLSQRYAMDFRKATQRYAALGEPAQVAEKIQAFHDAGVRHLVLDFVGPPEDRDAQIDWFAAEVMPRLRSLMGR